MGVSYEVLDDLSVSTCYELQSTATTIRHPTPAWLASSNVTVTLDVLQEQPLTYDVIAYAHADVYLKGHTGVFRACDMTSSMNTNDVDHYTYSFDCYCSYGVCEYVFTSLRQVNANAVIQTPRVAVCEVEFDVSV